MNPPRPLVSVVMITYNRPQYMREAVDSVINQTFNDIECIVIDNGSENKEPHHIAREYAQSHKRLRAMQITNSPLPVAFNVGIRASRGEFIIFHADDDVAETSWVEKCATFMRGHPETDAVMPMVGEIDEKANMIPSWSPPPPMHKISPTPPLSKFQQCLGPFGMFRLAALKNIGGFRDFFYCSEDTDLSLRWLEKFNIDYINEILYLHRNHGNNLSYNPSVGLYTIAALTSAHYRRRGKPCPIDAGMPLWDVVALAPPVANEFPPEYDANNIFRLVIKSGKGEIATTRQKNRPDKVGDIIRHRKAILRKMGYSKLKIAKGMAKLGYYALVNRLK